MKRRTWILGGVAATGGLVVGWGVMPARSRKGSPELMLPIDGEIGLNGWIKITPDNFVVLAMARSEMGQGVHTALPMLVAEELDVPLTQVRIEQAGHDKIYGNVAMFVGGLPLHPKDEHTSMSRGSKWAVGKIARELGINATGGSSSVSDAWEPLRQAAAVARGSLLGAASLEWKLPVAELVTKDGIISHASGKRATFAELAKTAAITPPASVAPKAAQDWKLIGTSAMRADVPAKVFGLAVYGIDVREKDLLFAAVRMAPALGGQPGRIDSTQAMSLAGAVRIVQLPADAGSTAGFAVVGTSYWHASRAADAVQADWRSPPSGAADSDAIWSALASAASERDGYEFHSRGDVESQLFYYGAMGKNSASRPGTTPKGAKIVKATYYAPYLAHATLEPMNCTARVSDAGVEIWAPTQVPGIARAIAARIAGVREDRVKVHVTLLGGGFGRRLEVDFVAQAVRVAMECNGRPVQLIWSREQDTTHDVYRPAQACEAIAAIDNAGVVTALRIRTAGDAITPRWLERTQSPLGGPIDTPDKTTSEGLFDMPYGFEHQTISHKATRSGVPIGFWRSVGHSQNAFFGESLIDEIAHAAGIDPLVFRQNNLSHSPRHLAVLNLAAEKAGWDKPAQAGRKRGIAIHESFDSIVAQVAEVSAVAGQIRVHRVVCAIDCGAVVNPGIVAQQMESSVVFGLTAALHGAITIKAGQVQQQNFNDYPMIKLAQAPVVETHIVKSTSPPTGVGEPGLPPLAPAVANAWFALTKARLRNLPLVPVGSS